MKSFQRKRNLVDQNVQGGLVRRMLFHWLVFLAATALTFVVLRAMLGDPRLSIGERLESHVGDFVLLAALLVSLLPAFMLDMIRFSNRFVGPLVRMRSHVRNMADGSEGERICFRKQDFWRDFADDFNALVELVNRQRARIVELEAARSDSSEPANLSGSR